MGKDDSALGLILLGLGAAAAAALLAKHQASKTPRTVRCPICGGYFTAPAAPNQQRVFTFCPYCSRMVLAGVV